MHSSAATGTIDREAKKKIHAERAGSVALDEGQEMLPVILIKKASNRLVQVESLNFHLS